MEIKEAVFICFDHMPWASERSSKRVISFSAGEFYTDLTVKQAKKIREELDNAIKEAEKE